MNQQNITVLRQLKLNGMAQALLQQLEQPGTYQALSFEERLQLLLDHEQLSRDNRKQQRLLTGATLKVQANARDINYEHPRGLNQSVMAGLLGCGWVNARQNVLLTGPCGSGKTYLACALAHSAISKGHSAKYYRLSRLLLELSQHKADGSYSKALKQIAKYDVLILDDWGLEPLKAAQRNDLMEIMDDRHQQASTVMVSQLPTEEWYQAIGDNTLADAILDRLMHNAHRIKLKGESMRKSKSELTENEHLS